VSSRDPFLRAVLIVIDRMMVFAILVGVLFTLTWDVASRAGLGLRHFEAAAMVWRVVRGEAPPAATVIAALALVTSVLLSAIVSAGLFWLWRRRAELSGGHVRGPRIGE
jgi:hypothetical protein